MHALMRQPSVARNEAARESLGAYGRAFRSWDVPTRMEQYNALYTEWESSGHDHAAAFARVSKALAQGK